MKITGQQLDNLAEPRYIQRGEEIYDNRMVDLMHVSDTQVDAVVMGHDIYETKLFKTSAGYIEGKCSCLSFRDNGPCKHMAAVAFALMDENYKATPTFAYEKEQIDVKKAELQQRDTAELVAKILELEQKIHELSK